MDQYVGSREEGVTRTKCDELILREYSSPRASSDSAEQEKLTKRNTMLNRGDSSLLSFDEHIKQDPSHMSVVSNINSKESILSQYTSGKSPCVASAKKSVCFGWNETRVIVSDEYQDDIVANGLNVETSKRHTGAHLSRKELQYLDRVRGSLEEQRPEECKPTSFYQQRLEQNTLFEDEDMSPFFSGSSWVGRTRPSPRASIEFETCAFPNPQAPGRKRTVFRDADAAPGASGSRGVAVSGHASTEGAPSSRSHGGTRSLLEPRRASKGMSSSSGWIGSEDKRKIRWHPFGLFKTGERSAERRRKAGAEQGARASYLERWSRIGSSLTTRRQRSRFHSSNSVADLFADGT
mmetsp:Transcript_17550/g.38094  ORF Transcript_17550/g.38094 Transcript_17550/m.38094 type:complete len:350 (+) Transcript_17550:258-1307(+)